jgi:elongation factor G
MKQLDPRSRLIISVTISPKFIADWDTLQRALSVLIQQDRGVRTATEGMERRVIISGAGELHLEAICDRLLREFKIPLDVGKPEIVYLETIRKSSEAEGKYIRQVGGHGQYAHVKINLEPAPPGSGYQFIDKSSANAVPRQFVESIDSGIQEAMKAGVLNGNEIVDVRVVLCGGSYHVEDSTEMAFKIAGGMAFKEAARKAKPVILEPFMSMDVRTPDDYAGSIVADLSSRCGRIERIDTRGHSAVIHAVAPLKELLGYSSHLRAITQGRGSTSMQFASYGLVSKNDGSGADEIGVPINKPTGPTKRSGFAAAEPDDLFA